MNQPASALLIPSVMVVAVCAIVGPGRAGASSERRFLIAFIHGSVNASPT